MEQQRSWEKPALPPTNINEPHMALVLLLDTSGSMYGTPIDNLNNGIAEFARVVKNDPHAKSVVDISIMTFDDEVTPRQDWTPVESFEPGRYDAGGMTNMASAIEMAIEQVDIQSRKYRALGTAPYKPWIVMITDGYSTSDDDSMRRAKELLREKVTGNFVKFIPVGVGQAYDAELLSELGGNLFIHLEDDKFLTLFDWIGKSMRAVSQSAPGEKAILPPLKDGVNFIVTQDPNALM